MYAMRATPRYITRRSPPAGTPTITEVLGRSATRLRDDWPVALRHYANRPQDCQLSVACPAAHPTPPELTLPRPPSEAVRPATSRIGTTMSVMA